MTPSSVFLDPIPAGVSSTPPKECSLSPTFCESGPRDVEAAAQLRDFAKKAGGKVSGSSTGFRVPGAGLKSPDAAWTGAAHLERLSAAEKRKFWAVCPDVVVEILSETDSC